MTQIKAIEEMSVDMKASVSPSARQTRMLEKIEYIRCLTGQLGAMARAERAELLEYFLSMAYIEASDILRAAVAEGSIPATTDRLRKVS